MKVGDYTNLLIALAKDVAEDKGWDFVKNLALLSRKEGLVKDPPLVVGELFPSRAMITELLSDYPLNKIYLYALIARKKLIPTTWGRMKKKAIQDTLNSKPVEWLEFQAIKYKNYLYWILKNLHPRPANEEISNIYGWVVGKKEPPSERARLRDLIASKTIKGNEALAKAIEHRLPWEIIRGNVSVDELDESLFKEAVKKIFTAHDIATQLSTIARKLGVEETKKIVSHRINHIPLAPLYRAITGILLSPWYGEDLKDLARDLDKTMESRANQVLGQLKSVLSKTVASKTIALIDISSSMEGKRIKTVIETLAPLYRAIDRFFVFNSEWDNKMRLSEISIKNIDDVTRLYMMTYGGTPLWEALVEVGNIAKREDAVLLVFTDEQENVSKRLPYEVELVLKDVPTIVLNPAPYPTDFIPKERGKIIGLPGSDINAVLSGLRIQQLNQLVQTRGRVDIDTLLEYGLVKL